MDREPIQVVTEKQVYAELEEARKNDPTLLEHLNNFHYNLPGMPYRTMFERSGMMDIPPGEMYPADDSEAQAFSARHKSQTYREFFAEIDQALEQTGIDPKELEKEVKETKPDRKVLIERSIPAYVKLRVKGYFHFPDLTA